MAIQAMKNHEKEWLALLKGVSRSFYLSLRLLPAPMRRGAALAYLLARASDTIADTSSVALGQRVECLARFRDALEGDAMEMPACLAYQDKVQNHGERLLIRRMGDVWNECRCLPGDELSLVAEVIKIIVGGQQLDLIRFAEADGDHPVALASREELDDYTYQVAGCVGEFWTKLGLLTLGETFSRANPDTLCEWGRAYGMGLQLVNILRDLPEDLAAGRCYLPVSDTGDRETLLREHRHWLVVARDRVALGRRYAEHLRMKRLRLASGLPATIAMDTLQLMEGAGWNDLAARIKVPRRKVYAAVFRGFLAV